MNQNRNQYSASKKVEILREHLENQVSISGLSRCYGVNPNLIHKCSRGVSTREEAVIRRCGRYIQSPA